MCLIRDGRTRHMRHIRDDGRRACRDACLVGERRPPVDEGEARGRARRRWRVLELNERLAEVCDAVKAAIARHRVDQALAVGGQAAGAVPDAAAEARGGRAPRRRGREGLGAAGEHPASRVLARLLDRAESDENGGDAVDRGEQQRGALLALRRTELLHGPAVPGVVGGALEIDRRVDVLAVLDADRVTLVNGRGPAPAPVRAGPGHDVHDAGTRVDHRGAQHAPVIVNSVEVDRLLPGDGCRQGALPQLLAGGRVERPDLVGHVGQVDHVVLAAVGQLHGRDRERLGLDPSPVTRHGEGEGTANPAGPHGLRSEQLLIRGGARPGVVVGPGCDGERHRASCSPDEVVGWRGGSAPVSDSDRAPAAPGQLSRVS